MLCNQYETKKVNKFKEEILEKLVESSLKGINIENIFESIDLSIKENGNKQKNQFYVDKAFQELEEKFDENLEEKIINNIQQNVLLIEGSELVDNVSGNENIVDLINLSIKYYIFETEAWKNYRNEFNNEIKQKIENTLTVNKKALENFEKMLNQNNWNIDDKIIINNNDSIIHNFGVWTEEGDRCRFVIEIKNQEIDSLQIGLFKHFDENDLEEYDYELISEYKNFSIQEKEMQKIAKEWLKDNSKKIIDDYLNEFWDSNYEKMVKFSKELEIET